MEQDDQDEGNWEEMDEVAFRKEISDIITYQLPEEGFDERLAALSSLRTIVMEEIAQGFRASVANLMELRPLKNISDARRLVEQVMHALDTLGLAIKDPESGKPMRLTLARTPPGSGESWLQLEAMSQASRPSPIRLPAALPRLALCPRPDVQADGNKQAPGR